MKRRGEGQRKEWKIKLIVFDPNYSLYTKIKEERFTEGSLNWEG